MFGPFPGQLGPLRPARRAAQDVRSGLVLAYDTLATQGNLLLDDSGAGNNGTVVGAIVGGGSVSFDGTDDYISLASAVTSPAAGITLSAWVKNATTSSSRPLISLTQASNNRVSLQISAGALVGGFYSGTYTDWSVALASTATWLHVAMTYSAANNVTLYQNTVTGADTGTTLVAAAALGTAIGSRTNLSGFYIGLMAHVRIYNRALSAEEISALYTYQRGELGV